MKLFKKNYSKLSDEELMTAFVKGDRKAFEEIFNRYESFMVNFFYRKMWQDREKAEDFTQDLFTKIIDKPHLFDTGKKFKTWIFTVASNMIKNEYKSQEIRKDSRHDVPEGYQNRDETELQDKKIDKLNFAERLNEELDKLGEKHKEVFVMRHFDGLSLKEIAEVLDINEGTVKSRLHNTTKLLAEKLEVFKKIIID